MAVGLKMYTLTIGYSWKKFNIHGIIWKKDSMISFRINHLLFNCSICECFFF